MQKEVPFSIAIESRYPEQIAICIARDPQGKYNPVTVGWVMPCSLTPPMFAVSLGKSRYSVEAFRSARSFVVAYPSEGQVDAARFFGTKSGRDIDKLSMIRLATMPAKVIDAKLLTDAVANFECRLVSEHACGDHVIFVGEVVCSHVTENPANRLFTLIRSQAMGSFRQK